ncbi:MAG: hypothetical protein IJ880_00970 [Bacilli bacterium]|nr:hypothetical protein [Bacilli bacterium]
MIDFDEFQKLKQEEYSARKSYAYSIKCLNNSIAEFQSYLNDFNSSKVEYTEEVFPELSVLSEAFLDLVINTKDYYDAKAEYEQIKEEYDRQCKNNEVN